MWVPEPSPGTGWLRFPPPPQWTAQAVWRRRRHRVQKAFSSGPADARTGSMRPRPAPRREHSGRPISRGGGVPTPHSSRPRPEVGLPLGPAQKETALPINRRSRAAAGRCGGSCPGPKGPQRVPAQSSRPHRQRGAEGLLWTFLLPAPFLLASEVVSRGTHSLQPRHSALRWPTGSVGLYLSPSTFLSPHGPQAPPPLPRRKAAPRRPARCGHGHDRTPLRRRAAVGRPLRQAGGNVRRLRHHVPIADVRGRGARQQPNRGLHGAPHSWRQRRLPYARRPQRTGALRRDAGRGDLPREGSCRGRGAQRSHWGRHDHDSARKRASRGPQHGSRAPDHLRDHYLRAREAPQSGSRESGSRAARPRTILRRRGRWRGRCAPHFGVSGLSPPLLRYT